MNTDMKASTDTFAKAVGLNARTVRRLVADGHLPRGGTLAQWIASYTGRLRDEAEARMGASDLPGERARLARAQAERIEMQNALMRSEQAPAETLDAARRQILDKVVDTLATIPAHVEQAAPHLVGELATVRAEIERVMGMAQPWK